LRSLRMIFPDLVLGSSETTMICLGRAIAPIFSDTQDLSTLPISS
jgi:hypothetical protein